MKTIIGGSREITNLELITDCIEHVHKTYPVSTLLCGEARGVDRGGYYWAKENGIPIRSFLPDWRLGNNAGILRNIEMVDQADFYICIWNGISPGTRQCLQYADRQRIGIFRFLVEPNGKINYHLYERFSDVR